ncbi:undecaprenyldiphospho-muramoylpentapeptide beta-N-acetylglucosaminyltransferase [Nocardioides pantholopis]|uniref:undecaprenyldiphospho-muramoylpentapeptide beta-N-acetylglucosaminyltransferase n=1 Tax=Nocardioides pantholopis TaxID=2483798 RepID=UPI000F088B89|nr:undecaprenyldiphospho-muramoylpentapeptide beta-N-acetylglucosaminyltransferase [Nocardioides pantholopis]
MRVLLAGGGTAGHTSPLLATADALRRLDPDVAITCLGTPRGLENTVVPAAGYPLELIPPVPLPRRLGKDLLTVPRRLQEARRATEAVFDRVRPDVLVGYGGYVSLPAYLTARKRGIPYVIHEQNAVPGLANRVGSRSAARVAVSFPDTPLHGAEYVGLPIRTMISRLDRPARRAEAREFFGLDAERPTLLVTGGSQGARRLNQAVSGAAGALAEAGAQVLHAQGKHGGAEPALPVGSAANPASDVVANVVPYVVLDYIDRMDLAYAAADLVVCRAGASSVSEAAAVGLPAVFVPLPIGNGEQERNARPVVAAGGGLLVPDAELTTEWVVANVPGLLTDPDRLHAMSVAAAGLVPRDADDRLAAMIVEAAR